MTKKLIGIFFLTFITLTAVLASPSDTTYKALKDTSLLRSRITTYSKNLLTLESSFVQWKYMSVLTEPSKSNGYFCFKNPGKVRWEYIDPFKYLVVINNDRLYMKDDKKIKSFEMTSSKSFVALSSGLGKLLQGDIYDKKSEFACKYFENESSYKVVLLPLTKELKKVFKGIQLYFDKKLFSVSRVVMIELSGDKTEIEFTGRKINEGVDDAKFSIK
jgi:outer membrane lipoprotein-sorting protein